MGPDGAVGHAAGRRLCGAELFSAGPHGAENGRGPERKKKGKLVLQLSYSLRMLATLAEVVLGVKLACFSWVATVIPLLFPRLTILAMQILGMYKPPKNKEGGDEPV